MRKKISAIVFILMMSVTANFASGCYGSFTLTKKVYNWNGRVGTKAVNSVVMWILGAVQAYTFCIVADAFVLNTLEHFSGTNPLAMNEGEQDIQIVQQEGKTFQITASKDRLDIEQLKSTNNQKVSLVFDRNAETWVLNAGTNSVLVAQMSETNENVLNLVHPDGSTVAVNLADLK